MIVEQMNIGLIDVDGHNFPNLCLMKLSAYHKSIGDKVGWWREDASHYDIVYMSKVFSDVYSPQVPDPINTDKIVKGGTGYAIQLEDGKEVYHREHDHPLPYVIEHIYPDYTLYPEYTGINLPLKKQKAYGFLTRGCPRGCAFCHVAPKEGRYSVKVADLHEFWRGQGNICLSDPNILACRDAPELLEQLIDSSAKIDFNQGLDARLITKEKADLLATMKLYRPHFAMDRIQDVEPVLTGLLRFKEATIKHNGKWNIREKRVFVLTNYDTTFGEDLYRVNLLRQNEFLPYIMIYNKPTAPSILKRLQRWCNFPAAFHSAKDFWEYQKYTYKTILYE